MTVNQLIKKLEKVREIYGKTVPVVVNKRGLENSTPDDYSYGNVDSVEVETINWYKDDSCVLADGSERMKTVVTLCGE